MNPRLLVCLGCGAPLGRIDALPAIVECSFCNAVISVGTEHPVITKPSAADAKRDQDLQAARVAFIGAVDALAKSGREPFEALCEAASTHLGVAGQTDALARIVFALALDFEAESGVSIRRDGIALNRIAEGYLKQLESLRETQSADLNLPFLAVDSHGPKHLRRTLTPALLAELVQREPGAGASSIDSATAKKAWWRFW